jgi:hypothetical protein
MTTFNGIIDDNQCWSPFFCKLQVTDGGSFRYLFHTTNTTTNTWIKIVGRKLYGYCQYHVDANICKCVLIW